MIRHIPSGTLIKAAGTKPKEIREIVGRVNTKSSDLSIAHMKSPSGWVEPGQKPEFDEYTYVLRGTLRVEHQAGVLEVKAGEAVWVEKSEWVQYSTPGKEGAEYIAICLPAFSPEIVHRDS